MMFSNHVICGSGEILFSAEKVEPKQAVPVLLFHKRFRHVGRQLDRSHGDTVEADVASRLTPVAKLNAPGAVHGGPPATPTSSSRSG